MDNVFIERLWRSVKYQEVYLRAYERLERRWTVLKVYAELQDAADEIVHIVEVVHLDELSEQQINDALEAIRSMKDRLVLALNYPDQSASMKAQP
jgi:hypothetical protein